MMQKMGEKIEKDGKKEADLYENFECYCKGTIAELQKTLDRSARPNKQQPNAVLQIVVL